MIIIHVMSALPRLAARAVAHAVGVMPVTVLTGARQTGKSTLVRDLATRYGAGTNPTMPPSCRPFLIYRHPKISVANVQVPIGPGPPADRREFPRAD